jgi:SP family general alpha glucoside:H+ symporter-like MFS transporter
MSSGDVEKRDASDVDNTGTPDVQEKKIPHEDVLVDQDLLTSAYDGENREHEMGAWEAVKLHPMACFWAFIFCFTIVRLESFEEHFPCASATYLAKL